MKKSPSPSLHQSNKRKKNVDNQGSGANNIGNGTQKHNPKNRSTMTYFKSVVKKCSGLFTLFLPGKTKTTSEAVENDSTKNKVRGVSCKFMI